MLARWELDGTAPDALLVLTELLANAIRHSQGPVEVVLTREPAGVRVEVADSDPARMRQPSPLSPPALPATSGRGLQIVAALATQWGVSYHRDGKVVWAELDA